jgi:large subunit ribosomal protein L31e
MANLERIYTIPLAEAFECPRNRRGKRAVRLVQSFALRHMKADAVRISEGLNSLILRDGIQKPPRRVKVRMVKGEDNVVRVWLIGEEEKVKAAADAKKKQEEEKKKKTDEAKKAAEQAKEEEKPAKPSAHAPAAKAPAPAAAPQAQPAKK